MEEVAHASSQFPADDNGSYKVVRIDPIPVELLMTPTQPSRGVGSEGPSPVGVVPSTDGSLEATPLAGPLASPLASVVPSTPVPAAMPPKPKLTAAERAAMKAEKERLAQEKLAEKERLKAEKEREKAEKEKQKAEKEKQRLEKERLKAEREAEKEKERQQKESERLEKEKERQEKLRERQEKERAKAEERAAKEEELRKKQEEERKKEAIVQRQAAKMSAFFKPSTAESKKRTVVVDDGAAPAAIASADASDKSACSIVAESAVPIAQGVPFYLPLSIDPTTTTVAPACRVPLRNVASIDEELANFCDSVERDARAVFAALRERGIVRRRAEGQVKPVPTKRAAAEGGDPTRRFKLLQFSENRRPAYCGTWSKVSTCVSGRRPFGKDERVLDYEVDSDEDWESEGEGEDISESDGGGDEDEAPAPDADGLDGMSDDDGFVVPHGYLSEDEGVDADVEMGSNASDNDDPVTAAEGRRKRKFRATDKAHEAQALKRLRPMMPRAIGGFDDAAVPASEATELEQYRACFLFDGAEDGIVPTEMYYDEEGRDREQQKVAEKEREKEKERQRELPRDALAALVRIVHGSSRGILHLVDEFKTTHADYSKTLIDENIRAIAAREKRPTASNGLSRWYVRDEVLAQLSLETLVPKQSPPRERPPRVPKDKSQTKADPKTDAPKMETAGETVAVAADVRGDVEMADAATAAKVEDPISVPKVKKATAKRTKKSPSSAPAAKRAKVEPSNNKPAQAATASPLAIAAKKTEPSPSVSTGSPASAKKLPSASAEKPAPSAADDSAKKRPTIRTLFERQSAAKAVATPVTNTDGDGLRKLSDLAHEVDVITPVLVE